MSHPQPPPATSASASAAPVCAACGARISGRFCAHCGAPAGPGECSACRSVLTPGARFCHRCGAPAGQISARRSRERLGWIFAGLALLVAAVVILWRAGSLRPTAPPEMGNVGNVGAAGTGGAPQRPAPDISSMSPEERFDRLFNRVARASESGDTLTVLQFAPMALGAYAMLDSTNNDLRFHAALIHLAAADFPGAWALADTILTKSPGHLFGYLIRGEAADRQNQAAALAQSYRDFLGHYEAEMRAGRQEYAEHRPVLDDFRVRAEASIKSR